MGYLIFDALECELVPAEARTFGKKAVLAITYLSEQWRVCRSPSDALFLFERASAGAVDRL